MMCPMTMEPNSDEVRPFRMHSALTPLRLVGASAVLLMCAACTGHASTDGESNTGGTSSASCVAPYLDAVPPNAPSVAAASPVSPGDSLTFYGHWYTSTCNDTGGH